MMVGVSPWEASNSKIWRQRSSLRIQFAMAITALIFTSACASTSQDEYELSYEECKNMSADKNHRFWKQPIPVQGCELIIFEVEVESAPRDQ